MPSEDLIASGTLTIVETLPPIFGERLDLQTSHPSEVHNNRPWLKEITSLQRSIVEFYTSANENELKTCSGVDSGHFAKALVFWITPIPNDFEFNVRFVWQVDPCHSCRTTDPSELLPRFGHSGNQTFLSFLCFLHHALSCTVAHRAWKHSSKICVNHRES